MTRALALVSVLVALPARSAEPVRTKKPMIAVLPAKVSDSANAIDAALLDEALLAAVQRAGAYVVIGRSDMNAVLGFEKQKDLMGCGDTACFAEIGGALGVDALVEVQLGRSAEKWVIGSKIINISRGTPTVDARRFDTIPGADHDLYNALPELMRALFTGTEPIHAVNQGRPAHTSKSETTAAFTPPLGAPRTRGQPVKPAAPSAQERDGVFGTLTLGNYFVARDPNHDIGRMGGITPDIAVEIAYALPSGIAPLGFLAYRRPRFFDEQNASATHIQSLGLGISYTTRGSMALGIVMRAGYSKISSELKRLDFGSHAFNADAAVDGLFFTTAALNVGFRVGGSIHVASAGTVGGGTASVVLGLRAPHR